MSQPKTREEEYLSAIASGSSTEMKPVTREEVFLAKATGQSVAIPEPKTRKELFLRDIALNGSGGGSVILKPFTLTKGGTYKASDYGADGFSSVFADVDPAPVWDGSFTIKDKPNGEELQVSGSVFYTLAPTALSFRSTAPLNEFKEVKLNGVTVDPSNYTLEEGSTIVTFPIDYLNTLNVGNYEVAVVSDSKTVKGYFTVATPELNEYGFYYNQPYCGYVDALGINLFIVLGTGWYAILTDDGSQISGLTSINDDIKLTNTPWGDLHITASSDGTELYNNETGATFMIRDERCVCDEHYIYLYNEELSGYTVMVLGLQPLSYSAIKTGIYGYPTVMLGYKMFERTAENNEAVKFPAIPDGVTTIGGYAFYNCVNLDNVIIPSSVTTIGENAFSGCTGLMNITFEGTVEQWNAISFEYDNWHTDVPATHVQCSDGQVSLV